MAEIVPPVETPEADVSALLAPWLTRRVRIRLDPRLFDMRLASEAERVRQVLRGFAIAERQSRLIGRPPESLALIGAGTGVEAIGAAHIFKSLRRIAVTDRDAALLAQAVENIRAHIPPGIEIEAVRGTGPAPLVAPGGEVDLLYANLIDLPFTAAPEAIVERGTWCPPVEGTMHDNVLNLHQMALPYHFLTSARAALRPRGCAIVLLGGRCDYSAFDRLADAAGLQFDELLAGLKRQTDCRNVIAAYAAAEDKYVEFDFYDFDKARRYLRGNDTLPGEVLKGFLWPWRLTAHAALREFHAGASIGHAFHLMRARVSQGGAG